MENSFTIGVMTYKEWIAQITGGMSHREIAEAINTSHPTVGRNIRSGKNADFTITIAAHFGANPVEGLVQGDIINTEQIAEYAVDHGIGIEHYTDLDLARIIMSGRVSYLRQHDTRRSGLCEMCRLCRWCVGCTAGCGIFAGSCPQNHCPGPVIQMYPLPLSPHLPCMSYLHDTEWTCKQKSKPSRSATMNNTDHQLGLCHPRRIPGSRPGLTKPHQ